MVSELPAPTRTVTQQNLSSLDELLETEDYALRLPDLDHPFTTLPDFDLKSLDDLPLRELRAAVVAGRRALFERPRPENPYYVVEATAPEVVSWALQNHYRPSWLLSFHYHGETFNASRAELPPVSHRGMTFQTHVRGYQRDDGLIELQPHYEPCGMTHPTAHLDGDGFDVEHALDVVAADLDAAGVSFDTVRPDSE